MSGPGLRTLGLHGDSRSKRNSSSRDYDPIPDEAAKAERLAKDKLRMQPPPALPAAPDLGDIALRDATSGRVRKVRAGSTRDSILGQAMQVGFLLCLSVLTWLHLREP